LKRKLDEVSSLKNVVNRNLQEDLRYERELNEKLREELGKFDNEKQQLLQKLRNQEDLAKEISRETSAISANLKRKNDDLRTLEEEHERNLAKLRDLNNQLDSMRQQEAHSKTEKRRMEEELDGLNRERSDLIQRMNELSDKYEDYVQTMNRERQEIIRSNKNHVKLLTGKLLGQVLAEAIYKRRKEGFQSIRTAAFEMGSYQTTLTKFGRILYNYGKDRKRHYLRLWYRNSLNFLHENYKKLNLVEFNVNRRRKMIHYYKWRSAFLQNRKSYESKSDSVRMLKSLVDRKSSYNLRHYLCRWRDFVELRQFQQDILFHMMGRTSKRRQRNAFVRWLGFSKKQALEEKYEEMSEAVTTLWFKQRVFLALKHATLEQKTEGSILKFKAWKNWCEQNRKEKYFQRKEILVSKIEGTRAEQLLK